MKSTEDRLREALKTVGDTMGSEDVPPMRRPVSRRSGLARPAVLASACAVALVLLGGLVVGGKALSGDGGGAASSPPEDKHVAVFLCTKTSSNASCGHAEATDAQKADIKERLANIRQVRQVGYESKLQAYERFKKAFSDKKHWEAVKPGDIPEAFRVRVSNDGVKIVQQAVIGLPGVDTVIVEDKPRA
ncbi:permease-like cell division protein FtsX [Actinomadura litoris]|uniref:permease-like cell division protein FtsX n=1 Tax=Actinomadura litoris TaxID=2678616 RepID=UPI001FA77CC8|nr:permease-like cell division protein FtsX [Actinomadura litoris]